MAHSQRKKISKGKKSKRPALWPLRLRLLSAGLLAVVAMALYAPTLTFDYVYDDDAVLVQNVFVKDGLAGLDEIWTTSYFKGYDPGIDTRAYRPLPLTTLAIEYELFGLNPAANHASNVLMYGLTVFVLFLFLSHLLRRYHPLVPILIVLFFALHPVHVEVPANVKSRDTMLGFLNFSMAAWLLLQYYDRRRWPWLAGSLVFYLLALFAKEEVITTVALIPLMLWFFRTRKWQRIAALSWPYAAAAAFFLAVRSSILGGLNAGIRLTYLDNSLLAARDLSERIASNILVLGKYLYMTLWPDPLISDYSYLTLPLVSWDDWRVWAALAAHAVLLWLLVRGWRKRRLYAFGIAWYFITVSIFTSIVVTNVSAYNDRFLYVPVLGILIALVDLLRLKVFRLREADPQWRLSANWARRQWPGLALVAVLCGLAVWQVSRRLPDWKDRYALFEKDVQQAPDNARLLKNYGGSLARLALDAHRKRDYARRDSLANRAIEVLQHANARYEQVTGLIHLGNMYMMLGRNDQAEPLFNKALQRDPDNRFAKTSLANIYRTRGEYARARDLVESIPPALRSKNDHLLLSLIYDALGDPQKADYHRRRAQ